MNWGYYIKWMNDNSGFLSFIIFIVTLLFGWVSGLFSSLIKKPKLKVRFIEKATFYSFFVTGNKFFNKELNETFDLHQTGFAVYMSIANIGNMPTSIDKIYLGYYRNSPNWKIFDKQINWLAQYHTFDHFKFQFQDKVILIPPLRGKSEYFFDKQIDSLEIGKSIVGIAYFEQEESWGNYNPKTFDNTQRIKVIIRIHDIYGKKYYFKTILNPKKIEDAIIMNSSFGNCTNIVRKH